MFAGPMGESIIGRAVDNNLLELNIMNIRDYTKNKHKKVDDYPYGGGAGMVMQADPIFNALENIDTKNSRIIYMTPKGKVFNQDLAIELSKEEHIVFLCGHYEGVDQRVIDHWVTDEVSIGDYVLTGGELPAMVMIDSIARMIPGVLGQKVSYMDESIYSGLLEYPHYTRPSEYRDMPVPEVLLSGNHKRIEEWRMEKSLEITRKRRPDMYKKYKNL
jgi:tRNA (guanine37-N1)-methyltransferase